MFHNAIDSFNLTNSAQQSMYGGPIAFMDPVSMQQHLQQPGSKDISDIKRHLGLLTAAEDDQDDSKTAKKTGSKRKRKSKKKADPVESDDDKEAKKKRPAKRRKTAASKPGGRRKKRSSEKWELVLGQGEKLLPGTDVFYPTVPAGTKQFGVLRGNAPTHLDTDTVDLENTTDIAVKELIEDRTITSDHVGWLVPVDDQKQPRSRWYRPPVFWQYQNFYELSEAEVEAIFECKHSARWAEELKCFNRTIDDEVVFVGERAFCKYIGVDRFTQPLDCFTQEQIKQNRRAKSNPTDASESSTTKTSAKKSATKQPANDNNAAVQSPQGTNQQPAPNGLHVSKASNRAQRAQEIRNQVQSLANELASMVD